MKTILICCATARGLTFVKHLQAQGKYTLRVMTCENNPEEPPFTTDIMAFCIEHKIEYVVGKKPVDCSAFWEKSFDILFAVGWRYIIPKEYYSRATIGAFVFHDSMLPKYRGFAPTIRAMLNDENTGVSLIEMAESVDEGDIIYQEEVGISKYDTIKTVMDRVTSTYLHVFDKCIDEIAHNKVIKFKQNCCPTYSPKFIFPDDYYIDWNKPTWECLRFIRTLTYPYPGARCSIQDVVILEACDYHDKTYVTYIPGRVVEKSGSSFVVMAQDGCVKVTKYQGNVKLHETLV